LLTTGVLLFCLNIPLSAAEREVVILTYHDVVEDNNELANDAVTTDHLVGHFEWLKANGYHPVSIDDLRDARDGIKSLPDKPVFLSWDDGYTSFYTYVFPLLKAYNYPAAVSIVGSWMVPGENELVQYGNKKVARNKFMSWKQLQEIHSSGLVEIASHSYNMHTDILATQLGDRIPSACMKELNPKTKYYETDQQYRQRIKNDLQASSDQILNRLGFRPRVMVWPYGCYNQVAVNIAAEIGMSITLSIDPVPADIEHLEKAGRFYLTKNPDIQQFRSFLHVTRYPDVKRFFRADSRDLLESSTKEEQRYDVFINRVKKLNPSMVIVDPVVKTEGSYKALFVNSRFPLAQDRLNRICWHTRKRTGTTVFLWLASDLFVLKDKEKQDTVNHFFSDMGKSAPVDGLIINNPILIKELLAIAGSKAKSQQLEPPSWNPDVRQRARQGFVESAVNWKAAQLLQPIEAFQQWQPFLEVSAVLSMKQFLSMELKQFNLLFKLFDFITIDVGDERVVSFKEMVKKQVDMLHSSKYMRKISFIFSAGDGINLSRELEKMPEMNIINWGYQFDNFLKNIPNASLVKPFISKQKFPYPLHD